MSTDFAWCVARVLPPGALNAAPRKAGHAVSRLSLEGPAIRGGDLLA